MEPLKIGNIVLPHRAVFGPMAGFTDAPCRRLMAQHGAGFTVSEMVSSRALVYGDHKTVSLLKAEPNGAPYGVQIFGEVPQIMGEAAAAIENLTELTRENDKREAEAEENAANLKHKLACKQTENSILRSELRRMFRLYVAAEMRADTGTEED